MAKYSKELYEAVANGDMRKAGVRLGAACIDAQIPVQVVAKWLKVTRQAVYFWFAGVTEVAARHAPKVDRITKVLLAALDAEELPAKDLPTALEIVNKYKELIP